MRIPTPLSVARVGRTLIADAVRSVVLKYDRPHNPGLERTVVAIGPGGCFDELLGSIREVLPDGSMNMARTAFNFEETLRLHAVPYGDADILIYAPTNLAEFNKSTLFPVIDSIYGRVTSCAEAALLVEYGSHSRLTDPLSVIDRHGEFPDDAPAIALTTAVWGWYDAGFIRASRVGTDGPLATAFEGATTMFAIRPTIEEAQDALTAALEKFSRDRVPVRPPNQLGADCIAIGLGERRIVNAAGQEIAVTPGPAPR